MKRQLLDLGPWCTICGQPGKQTQVSLDTARLIGVCQRGAPKQTGCGRVILTNDVHEAEFVFDQRRRRYATARHGEHLSAKKRNPYCTECDEVSARLAVAGHGR